MKIGEKIKNLRKERDITQEKLAAYLSVSCQAISKWENGTSAPDISLIVPIANFFNVSTDALFGREEEIQQAEIEEYRKKDSYLSNKGLVKEQIELWREASAKYPKNYECLANYASSLHSAEFSAAFENEKELANEYTSEALKISERILEDCTETDFRDTARQILVLTYGSPGRSFYDEEKAEKYAKEASAMFCSCEILLESAYRIGSDKHLETAHFNALSFVDLLTRGLIFGKYKDSEEKIFALKTALNIYNALFYDGNFLFFHCRIARIYEYLAIEYAKLQDACNVLENLKIAKNHAISSLQVPDGKQYYTSVFLNHAYHENEQTRKNFSGTQIDLIAETLGNKAFDFMRGTKEFIEFESSLKG